MNKLLSYLIKILAITKYVRILQFIGSKQGDIKMDCGIEKQIASHCNEAEQPECPECFSSMTETDSVTSKWLQCDECEYQDREDT